MAFIDPFEQSPTTVTPGGTQSTPATVSPSLNRNGFVDPFEQTPSRAIEQGLQKNPDEAAEQRRLSIQTGIPQADVEQAPAVSEQQKRQQDIEALIAQDPPTQRFLSNPDNAAIAQDDVENLTSLSTILRSIMAPQQSFAAQVVETPWRMAQGVIQVDQAARRTLSSGIRTGLEKLGMTELAAALPDMIPSPIDPLQDWLLEQAKESRQFAQSLGPEEDVQSFGSDVGGGLGQMSAQIALILATGPAAATLGLAGEGASIQSDMMEEAGTTPEENPEAILMGAAVTALTERFGLDVLLNRIPAATKSKIMQVLVSAGSEGSQEIIEGVAQNLVALGIYDPDQEIFETSVLEEGGVAATTGAIISLIIPGRQSIRHKEILDQASEVAQNSKLNERAPEGLGEHIGEVLQDAGVPEVYVPGMQLAQWIMNQPDPQATMYGLGIQDQLEEAVALGSDVTIQADAFGQWALASQDYASLSEHVRTTVDGLTVAETNELVASGIQAEVARMTDSISDPAVEQDPDLHMAEGLMGLRGLFTTADEAGMTPKQYENYLAQIQRAAEKGAKNKEMSDLREQERQNTKEWNEEKQRVEANTRENFSNFPVYAAFNGIGAERLDRAKTKEIVEGLGASVDALPRQKGNRALYATDSKEPGMDPDTYAQLHGYEDAETMFSDMLTSAPFEQAVAMQTERTMRALHPDLMDQKTAILRAKQALLTDEHAELIAMELNAMRHFQEQKKLSNSVVRNAAKEQLKKYPVKDIQPNKFLNAQSRLARDAARALKKGDRATAVDLKFKQLMNYHMAKEATKMQETITRQKRYMAKFLRPRKAHQNMHPSYLEAIRELLSKYYFGDRLTPRRIETLTKLINKSADPIAGARRLAEDQAKTQWQDMTLAEFKELHDSVKEIQHQGMTENKLRLKTEERERDVIVAVLNEEVRNNLKKSDPGHIDPTKWQQAKTVGKEVGSLLMHIDTILREIDGFKDLGPAHENILGRYNRAINEGYQPDQIGFIRREKKVAQDITNLYKVFSKKERLDMHTPIKIPGVSRKISRATILATLLNSGNQGNIDAMVDSKTFTEAEIQAIHNYASKKDWDFAQSVWDYFETFWPDIVDAQQRRRNVTPEKVQAKSIDTPHGTYKGGYYPIRYNKKEAVFYSEEDAQSLIDQVRYGDHVSKHTNDGHTKSRKDSGGNPVLLDLFVINSHLSRVVYDLEMGDAITDIYKIVYDPDFKKALTEQGQRHKWEAMELWLRDIITGEVGVDNALEKGLRWLRTRTTVAGLGWNIGVIALQVLGLSQTAVLVRPKNLFSAMRIMSGTKWTGQNSVFSWVDSQSPFMASRSATWHKDIADAQTATRKKLLDKITPGNSADVIRESFFYGIKKMQRMVDVITWIAAKKQGMEQFQGDEKKAVRYADDVVMRSQASGVFGHRTAIERGSIGTGRKQTELVRAFTLFYSYFARKLNIAIERTKQTKNNPKPLEILKWSNDMALLFVWEALLAGVIRNQWPDEDDDESKLAYAGKEIFRTAAATVPFGREVVGAIEGFPAGGTLGRLATDIAKAAEQAGQWEFDTAFVKSINTLGGLFFKYPSGQINKFIGTAAKQAEGDDVEAMEWMMGPRFDR